MVGIDTWEVVPGVQVAGLALLIRGIFMIILFSNRDGGLVVSFLCSSRFVALFTK